jgi:hypothetical protein
VRLLAAIPLLLAAAPARAELRPPIVAPMSVVEGDVCALLLAERGDTCKRVAKLDNVAVYQSGSRRGVSRLVVAIDRGEDKLVGPSVDVLGEDCAGDRCVTLVAATPSMRAVVIDGRPAIVVDVVARFRAGKRGEPWQTEAIVGCGQTAAGAWRCATLDAGRCEGSVGDDGTIATSCGDRARLTLR